MSLRSRLDEVARVLSRDASLWPESAALRLACLEWREARAVSEVLRGLAAETERFLRELDAAAFGRGDVRSCAPSTPP